MYRTLPYSAHARTLGAVIDPHLGGRGRAQQVKPIYSLAPEVPGDPLGTIIVCVWQLPLEELRTRKRSGPCWTPQKMAQAIREFVQYCKLHGVIPEPAAVQFPQGSPQRLVVRINAESSAFRRFSEQARRLGFTVRRTNDPLLPSEMQQQASSHQEKQSC